jgi:hypothetical protein
MIRFLTLIHFLIISLFFVIFSPFSVSAGNEGVSHSGEIEITPLLDTSTDIRIREEKKILVMQDINAYILEAYKAQGDKILRNLDISLRKAMTKKEDQIDAYRRLRSALIDNRDQTRKIKMSDTRRTLVVGFLGYLIDQLSIRIEDLKEE